MGHIRQPAGVEDPAYKLIRRLIDKGRTWVKLSVTYDSSKDGPPGYADVNKVGAGLRQGRARAHGVGLELAASERDRTSPTTPCCST